MRIRTGCDCVLCGHSLGDADMHVALDDRVLATYAERIKERGMDDVDGNVVHWGCLMSAERDRREAVANERNTENAMLHEALKVQDACNLSGVVHKWSEFMTSLWARAREQGKGTDWVNRHPVCAMFADKVAHITRTQGQEERWQTLDHAYEVANLAKDREEARIKAIKEAS